MKSFLILISICFLTTPIFSQAWMQYLPASKTGSSLTFFDYQEAFKHWCIAEGIDKEGYYVNSNGERQKAGGWKQFKRWEIAMEGYYNIRTGEIFNKNVYQEYEKFKKEFPAGAESVSGNWTSVAYGQEGSGNNGNGRVNCIAFHPTDPDIFWIGTAWGGIWETQNHGETWTPKSDFIGGIGIGSIAIPDDYETSHTIYLGTGDRGYYRDYGVGLLKSTDGGNTWFPTGLSYSDPVNKYIGKILIHPDDNMVILAATSDGVYKSVDGGVNFEQILIARAVDMEFHPTNPNIIYVSTRWDYPTNLGTEIIRTNDGGVTWSTVRYTTGCRTELAVSPDEPDWVYAIVGEYNESLLGVLKSTDSGATFSWIYLGFLPGQNILGGDCSGEGNGGQASYDLAIAVDPNDAERITAGGISIWQSTLGGTAWFPVTQAYTNCEGISDVVHVDIHYLQYRDDSDTIFATTDGGVYYSPDNSITWINISGGLFINQPYRISSSPAGYDEVLMGQQDNGVVLWDNNLPNFIGPGDGTNVIINPADVSNQYYTNNSSRVFCTNDHWETYYEFNTPDDYTDSWFKAIHLIPPDTILYGVHDLWKSTDRGVTMIKIWDIPEDTLVRIIKSAPSNSKIIYLLNQSKLYKSTDGGTQWTDISSSLPCLVECISNFEIKHQDPNTLWLTTKWWDDNISIFRSTDGGISWAAFNLGLPEAPWYDIVQNTLVTSYDELYACGFFGVFVKLGDEDWFPFNEGLPNLTSFDMDIMYDGNLSKLRLGTHGRGVWESDLYGTTGAATGTWLGTINSSWQNPGNWALNEVPDGTTDVLIPSTAPNFPVISADNAAVGSLRIYSGANLTIVGKSLSVAGDVDIYGTLTMTGTAPTLDVDGDIVWKNLSDFDNTGGTGCVFVVEGDWTFDPGSQANLASTTTRFTGIQPSTINVHSQFSNFGHLSAEKTGNIAVFYSAISTGDLLIHGSIIVGPNGNFTQHSSKTIKLYGVLDASGNFNQQHGKLACMAGGNVYISMSGGFINILELNMVQSSTTIELHTEISVRDTLILRKGVLNMNGNNLNLSGSLRGYPSAILQMNDGWLVFLMNDQQLALSDMTLENVELNKVSDTLRLVSGVNLTIDSLKWTAGAIVLDPGSTLTINDLHDNGIYGTYRVNDSSTLVLMNPTGPVNLNGKLLIHGGTVEVYGGATGSYWPDAASAELHMTSGTLDFKDVGVFVRYHPTYTFTENITGGVIRTSGDFMGDHTGFNPSGGVIELYGPDNVGLGHGTGSNFYKVLINKGSTTDEPDFSAGSDEDQSKGSFRHQKIKPPSGGPAHKKTPPPSGTRANKVTVYDNLDLDNQLVITSGILDINGKTVNVASDVDISGTLAMTSGTSALNAGTSVTWYPGSWANITAGTITFNNNWQFMDGTNAYLSGTNIVKATGTATGNVYHKDPDAYFTSFISDKASGILYLDSVSPHPMRVNGDLTVKNGSIFKVYSADLIVGGTFFTEGSSSVLLQSGGTIQSTNCIVNNTFSLAHATFLTTNGLTVGGTLNLTDGGTVVAENFILSGTLDINAGSVITHSNYSQGETGHLILDGGSFIIDKPYSGAYFGFAGITDLNGGFFEISYESVKFDPGTIVNILAGTFRIGGHFRAIEPNAFQPLYGAVEFINTTGSIIECNNGNYFHDFIINKSPGASPCTLAFATTIQNDLDIQSGQLSTSNNTLTVNENLKIQADGVLSAGSSSINVGDEWINNRGTDGFLEGTSTVFLVSGQTCTISPETFYRLEINKTTGFNQFVDMASGSTMGILNKLTLTDGTLRMSQNSTLNLFGDLHIKSGAGLNANAFVTGTTINCYGNWLDENTTTSFQVGFHSGQSNFNLTGSNVQEMTANDTVTFYNLNMQKTGESFKPATTITVLGDYHHSSGIWSYSTTGLTYDFEGDFTISSPSLWQDQVNTVNFTGTSLQSITNSDVGYLNFSLMEVTKPEAEVLTINSDLSLSNRLIINSGVAEVQNHRLMCQNGLDVYSGGEINLTGDVSAYMGPDGSFRIQGGDFNIAGTANQRANVTRASSGYYEFIVESGGTLTAEYTDFKFINSRGLRIDSDGSIGGEFPLLYCGFQQGESGGTLLQVNNAQEIVLHNVNFPANTWSGTNNVKKTNDAGDVTMASATGNFAGPDYENDAFGRIHWPAVGIWDGDISTEWHDARNWWYDVEYPNGSTDVVIPAGVPNFPILSQTEAYVNSMTIAGNANLRIYKDSLFVNTWVNNAGEINLGDENGNITGLFCDSIVWQPGSTANITDRGTFYITGNMLIRAGSGLNDLNGAWHFTGNDDSRLICHDTAKINNLYDYKNSGYGLNLEGDTLAQLTCSILRIGAGAYLRCPSSQEWVINAYLRNTDGGHIRLQNGTLRLKGNQSSHFRPNDGDYFNNLTLETNALVNLNNTYSDTLRIQGNLVINQGTTGTSGIQANAFKVLVWGNWVNNVGTTAFSGGTSKVVFMDPSVPQNVQGNTNFYNLTAGDWETSAVNFYGQNTISNIFESWFTTNVFGTLNANQVFSDNDFAFLNVYDGGAATFSTFQQGAPVHVYDGTFTVTDLLEDYVKGSYTIDEGLISLGQTYSPTASHDLYFANITINGGELRFTGGNGLSLWPRTPGVATVTMSDGVFDLTNQEIVIKPAGFTENITGGKIRTYWSFSADPATTTFHPTGGTVELYGSEDCSFSMPEPACWFYNLHLSKTDGGGAYPSSNMRVKNEFRLNAGAYMETDGFLITVGP